jgi:hypothetical protein
MGVKEQMIGILRSGEADRIRFSFRGTTGSTISVDRTSFERVATAIQNNTISIVEARFTTDIAMYSARADTRNNAAANTFYLGRNPRYSRLFNALVIHESVHASFDLARSNLPWVDNEAAAYIAQAYYARNSGLNRMAFALGSHPSTAYQLVTNMRANSTSDVDFFLDALRSTLRGDSMYSHYINEEFRGDG